VSEFGECALTQHLAAGPEAFGRGRYTITVDRADPRILISDGILTALTERPSGNWPAWQRNATLTCRGDITYCGDCASRKDWTGAVLRINGTNRTVIYRITGRHDDWTWIGEWPD
jgi:hypothetical protein